MTQLRSIIARWRTICILAGALSLLCFLLTGCEEDILMPEPSEKPFMLYSVLSP